MGGYGIPFRWMPEIGDYMALELLLRRIQGRFDSIKGFFDAFKACCIGVVVTSELSLRELNF